MYATYYLIPGSCALACLLVILLLRHKSSSLRPAARYPAAPTIHKDCRHIEKKSSSYNYVQRFLRSRVLLQHRHAVYIDTDVHDTLWRVVRACGVKHHAEQLRRCYRARTSGTLPYTDRGPARSCRRKLPHAMFIVTLLEACLTFVRRRCFRALYGAGVGKSRRRPRAPAPDTAPQTTPTPALPVIIHKHYVIGPETPGDATPRPPEQSGAQRTIFAAPQSETLSAWERLADDDEPFDDGEPLDDLPDDVTEQERAEIERFDLNRYR